MPNKIVLRQRYVGSQVQFDKEVPIPKDDRGEAVDVLAVKIDVHNGAATVIVGENGVIVTSIRGVEHSIKFKF